MTVVRIRGSAQWKVIRETDGYVAVCDALNMTAQADTWGELCQTIAEIHNELFHDLLAENELEPFLRKLGWQMIGPGPRADEEFTFDLPAYMIEAARGAENRTAC